MSYQSMRLLRITGFVEGLSYLLLLGVAMPLKYLAGKPEYVRVTGMAHGLLFVLLCLTILLAMRYARLPFRWAVTVFVASLIPLGTWVIDSRLARLQGEEES